MKQPKLLMLFIGVLCVVFYFVASGCATLTFTAHESESGQLGPIMDKNLRSIYVNLIGCNVSHAYSTVSEDSCVGLQEDLAVWLTREGYLLVKDPVQADLQMSLTMRFFDKKVDMEDFLLFIFPLGGSFWGDAQGRNLWITQGLDVIIIYKKGKIVLNKKYRLYNLIRPWWRTSNLDLIMQIKMKMKMKIQNDLELLRGVRS
ncbi:MAG: hypothetical protein WCI27_07725 [Candidatus Omnitrophota bacterium]